MVLRLNDALSSRSKDDNGFLIVRDNPIAKAGVFDYLGSELNLQDKSGLDPDAIYKVCRTFENLSENKDLFKGKPIKFTHKWVGGENADSNVAEGAIYGEVRAQEPYLRADIIIYNDELIKIIENGEAVELSPAYEANIIQKSGSYNGEAFEYMQDLLSVNHLAVVECGRSGSDLRIQDSKGAIMKKTKKSFADSVAELLKRFKDESAENETQDNEGETQDSASIDEILAVAMKAESEFAGGASEKAEALKSLLSQLSGTQDNEGETEAQDNEAESSEKEVQDEEAESSEAQDEETSAEALSVTPEELVELVEKIADSKIAKLQRAMDSKAKRVADTYAEVSKVLGQSFDYTGKSESDLYRFGFEAITKEKLADGLDAKTAFAMVKSKLAKPIAKVADSKVSNSKIGALLARHK